MGKITLKGNEVHIIGELPKVGSKAPDFTLTGSDLSTKKLSDFLGKKIVLNIFPSVDTGTCANSVRRFNVEAANMKDAIVLCISKDLPFAQSRFCGSEGIDNVEMLSDFRTDFGKTYGIELTDGPLKGLLSRSIVIINEERKIIYSQIISEISEEPDYNSAIKSLK